MIARAINFILKQTKLGSFLNERKTLIGAVLTVLAGVLGVLEKLVPMFPDVAYLVDAQSNLKAALDVVIPTLNDVGFGFLTVGLVHKGIKAKLPDA